MKLYQSQTWLYRRYVVQKKNVTEIAAECGVSAMTIQRYLEKFGRDSFIFVTYSDTSILAPIPIFKSYWSR